MKVDITIMISDGKVTSGRDRLKDLIAAMESGFYDITIQNKKRIRSLPQNAYYWGVVVPLVYNGLRDIGYEDIKEHEQAHRVMANLFLKKRIPDRDGTAIEYIQSTAELTRTEFMDYIDRIHRWASEYLNIYIPNPGEQSKLL